MTEGLLKELNNNDIAWMIATGTQQKIPKGNKLMGGRNTSKSFQLILQGSATVILSQENQNPLAQIFANLEETSVSGLEIMRLSRGEVVGENIFAGFISQDISLEARETCLLLSLPLKELNKKLWQDTEFAARFYRAIAVLSLNKLNQLLNRLGRMNFAKTQSIRDVLYIFSKLQDRDLDWAIANGILEKISANTTLIRQGESINALYLLLDGKMSVSLDSDRNNPLTNIFAAIEETKAPGKEIAKLHRGEIIGEAPFIDGSLSYATVTTTEDSLLLALPRPILIAKLQQDIGFAARFYLAISTLLADKLQGIISRLSVGRRTYLEGQSLNDRIKYEDELDTNTLEQMSLAATKFDWMLGQLKVS